MSTIGKVSIELEARLAKFESDMGRAARVAEREMEKMRRTIDSAVAKTTKRMDKIGESAANALKGVIAAVGVRELVRFGKAAIDAADQLNEMAQRVGVSTAKLSGLGFAAQLSGSNIEGLGKGFRGLAKSVDEAVRTGTNQERLFKSIGVQVKDAEGKTRQLDAILLDLADRFSGMPDGANKAALALKIFGRAGLELVPFLNNGKQGISDLVAEAERLGVVISGETAQAAAELNDDLDRLSAGLRGVANDIMRELMPTLLAATKAFTEMIKQAREDGSIQKLAEAVAGLVKILDDLAIALVVFLGIKKFVPIIMGLVTAVQSLGVAAVVSGRALTLLGGPLGVFATLVGVAIVVAGEWSDELDRQAAVAMNANTALATVGETLKTIAETNVTPGLKAIDEQLQALRDSAIQIDQLRNDEALKLEYADPVGVQNVTDKIAKLTSTYDALVKKLGELAIVRREVAAQEEAAAAVAETQQRATDSVLKFNESLEKQIESVRKQRIEMTQGADAAAKNALSQLDLNNANGEAITTANELIETLGREQRSLDATREAQQRANEAKAEAKRIDDELNRAAKTFLDSIAQTKAQLAGPAAQAQLVFNTKLAEAKDLYLKGKLSVDAYADAVRTLAAEYNKAADAAKKQLTPTQNLIRDLQFELDLIGKTNDERERATRLREVEGEATDEQKRQIDQLLIAGQQKRELFEYLEQQAQQYEQAWTAAVGSIAQAFGDFAARGFSGWKDFLRQMKDALKRWVAEVIAIMAQRALLNAFSGQSGGWAGAFQQALGSFGGGGQGGGFFNNIVGGFLNRSGGAVGSGISGGYGSVMGNVNPFAGAYMGGAGGAGPMSGGYGMPFANPFAMGAATGPVPAYSTLGGMGFIGAGAMLGYNAYGGWPGGVVGGVAGLAAYGAIAGTATGAALGIGAGTTAAAAGLAAGGGGAGAIAGAAAAVPVVGWIIAALAVIAMIAGVGKKHPELGVAANAAGITEGRIEGQATSPFGNIYVGKEDLSLSQSSQEFAQAIADFDKGIADMLNASEIERIKAALANFDVHQEGDNINPGAILEQRFNIILNQFDPAIQAFARAGATLQEDVERFGQALTVSRVFEDMGLDIDFAEFLDLARASQLAGEQFGDTVNRLVGSVHLVGEAFKVVGADVSDFGAEFITFSAEIVAAMGGLEKAKEKFDAFIEAFYSPQERLDQQLNEARDVATGALEAIGVDPDVTKEEFRELFDAMLEGTPTPEMVAQWIDAGIALDGATDAQEAYNQAMEETQRQQAEAAAALEAYNNAVTDLTAELVAMTTGWSPSQFVRDLSAIRSEEAARAVELNRLAVAAGMAAAKEEDLTLIHQIAAAKASIAIARLRAAAEALVAQLYGPNRVGANATSQFSETTSAIGEVDDTAADLFRSWEDALKAIQKFLDDILLDERLTTLTPQQQLAEAQSQFEDALSAAQGGDLEAAEALPGLAKELLDKARGFWASGDAYDAIFEAVLAGLQEIQGVANPGTEGSPTGGDIAVDTAIIEAEAAAEEVRQQRLLMAAELAGYLRDLADALGQSVFELADEMGIKLTEFISDLGIDLTRMSVETASQLAAVSNTLGVELSELTGELGISLGMLADANSYLNDALEAAIQSQPVEIRGELGPLLAAIESATNEADANAAIAELETAVNAIGGATAIALAPFLENVDPPSIEDQLIALDRIGDAADAYLPSINAWLQQIAINTGAQVPIGEGGINGFAEGTSSVPYDQVAMVHKGEKIIDARTSALLNQYGVPTTAVVEEDRRGPTLMERELLQELRKSMQRAERNESRMITVLERLSTSGPRGK